MYINKLVQRDKAILEYLTHKYGKEIVFDTIKEIKENNKNNKLHNGK